MDLFIFHRIAIKGSLDYTCLGDHIFPTVVVILSLYRKVYDAKTTTVCYRLHWGNPTLRGRTKISWALVSPPFITGETLEQIQAQLQDRVTGDTIHWLWQIRESVFEDQRACSDQRLSEGCTNTMRSGVSRHGAKTLSTGDMNWRWDDLCLL